MEFTAATQEVISRDIEYTTPWFQVVAKRTRQDSAPYYALRMLDYVSVLALTPERNVVFVRQFRPAVERFTLELPSGHVEMGEEPAVSAQRELNEECGLVASGVELLGTLISDTGRHENRLWCYLARDVVPAGPEYVPEPGVERVLIPVGQMSALILNAEFDHALNLAVVMLAVARHGAGLVGLK